MSVSLKHSPCSPAGQGQVAVLTLDRPDAANAFNGAMVEELAAHLQAIADDPQVRVLVVQGKGKNFCAGADLPWMQEQGRWSKQENLAAAETMGRMFRLLARVPCPTIGVAKGAVFGGGVGLIACCDLAMASDDARFCLSEVKIGLLPAVILPFVARKIPHGPLKRLGLSGSIFSAKQAQNYGLIEDICPGDELNSRLTTTINQLLAAAPQAQRRLKKLLDSAEEARWQADHQALFTAIAEARTGAEGQAGLQAFLQKSPPPWTVTLAAEWNS